MFSVGIWRVVGCHHMVHSLAGQRRAITRAPVGWFGASGHPVSRRRRLHIQRPQLDIWLPHARQVRGVAACHGRAHLLYCGLTRAGLCVRMNVHQMRGNHCKDGFLACGARCGGALLVKWCCGAVVLWWCSGAVVQVAHKCTGALVQVVSLKPLFVQCSRII
jgi:hypothetical protein